MSTINVGLTVTTYTNAAGKYHRGEDLPAMEWINGTKEWYDNGQPHRLNGPSIEWAIEGSSGTKEWWVNGQRHRGGGLPAIEYESGTNEWWVNGCSHREGGRNGERR